MDKSNYGRLIAENKKKNLHFQLSLILASFIGGERKPIQEMKIRITEL